MAVCSVAMAMQQSNHSHVIVVTVTVYARQPAMSMFNCICQSQAFEEAVPHCFAPKAQMCPLNTDGFMLRKLVRTAMSDGWCWKDSKSLQLNVWWLLHLISSKLFDRSEESLDTRQEAKVVWRRPHRMRSMFLYFTKSKISFHSPYSRRREIRTPV